MRFLKAFGAFWYDFVIGDDWKIAAYVVVTVGAVAALAAHGSLSDTLIALVGVVALGTCFVAGVIYDARRSIPRSGSADAEAS